MNISSCPGRGPLSAWGIVSLGLLGAIAAGRAQAQSITPSPDGTGTVVTETGTQYTITGGATSADQQNLFHSFQDFNLLTGEQATFVADPTILNILGRVTGGSPSLIDGLLQVSGSPANLFLINPSGILLGPNSALNLAGSFTATTADQVNFATGAFGTVGTPDYAALVGQPASFSFGAAAPGSVVNAGNLAVSPGESVMLIGGQVLNTGTITAPGGEVVISAVAGGSLVRIEQAGLLLNLEVATLADDAPTAPLPFTPLALPELLTGNGVALASQVTVNPDGTVQLTSGHAVAVAPGALTVAGTVAVSAAQGGQILVVGETASLPTGRLDISGTAGGGHLAIYASTGLTLGIDVDATGGGQALFDPPTLDINAPEAATIVATLLGGNAIISASEIININAAIDSSAQGNTNTLTLDDENGDNALTINLNAPIRLGAAQTLVGDGTTVNVNVTAAGIVQNGVAVAANGGTVNLAAGTYQAGQEILLARDVTLNGAGAGNTILDGNDAHRVLQVNGGVTASFNGLTITNGNAFTGAGLLTGIGSTVTITNSEIINNDAVPGGGGIFNDGNLTVLNSAIINNTSDEDGGGILNTVNGTVLIDNSTIGGNSVPDSGGGIANSGQVTIRNGTIINNNTSQFDNGGGIANFNSGNITIADSTLSGNSADFGGGIWNDGAVNLTNATLSGNSATDFGGGIWNDGAVNLTNATLSGNSASFGGGIDNSGTVNLTNATLSGNSATSNGGGISNNGGATVELANSLIANNTAGTDPDVFGTVTSLGFNLIGNSAGVTGLVGSDRRDIDPLLGPLADNGGPTQTQALLPGSPAINAGGAGATATDQRGVPAVGIRDIGAFELAEFVWLPVAGDGQSTLINTPFAAPLQVQLAEATSNQPVPFANLAVTFSAPTSGASGFFDGPATVLSDAQGLATSPRLTANSLAGNFTLTAIAPGVSAATFTLSNLLPPAPEPAPPLPPPEADPCPNGCAEIPPPLPLPPPEDLIDNPAPISTITILPDTPAVEALQQTEQAVTAEFTNHLELPADTATAPPTLADVQSDLQQAQIELGQTPAVLYVLFGPGQAPTPQAPLELLLVTAEGDPHYRQVPGVTYEQVMGMAQRFRSQVTNPNRVNTETYLPSAQALYTWLIAPLDDVLEAQGITTLTFVSTAGLRSIPFAALHDGDRFLVERYNLGLIPSLNLVDLTVGDIRSMRPIVAGASEFASLPPLPTAPIEISTIEALWSGQRLQEQDFTIAGLTAQRQRTPSGIIHLTTHGAFTPGALENSYIQFTGERLPLSRIRELGWHDPPVELVTLSACETALGNAEAELGFAGFALQAGAKSVLASLWRVSDTGTTGLMVEFYRQLQAGPIKAAALREAQLAMIRGEVSIADNALVWEDLTVPLPPSIGPVDNQDFRHPFYWSGFTLVGSPW